MLEIRPTLSVGQQGPDIANLHLVLDTLGFAEPVSQQERADKRFGDGTAEAVRRVQGPFQFLKGSIV